MGIFPDHVRLQLLAAAAGGAQQQDGAPLRQLMRHRHEIELAADAGHHLAVGDLVGHRRAEQGHLHGDVDEARMAPLQAL